MAIFCSIDPIMIQREHYMRQLRLYRGQPLIKILTGIRRCGKSTLLGMVRDEIAASGKVPPGQIISLNFEDMAHRDKLTADALYEHLRGRVDFAKPFCIFLDEIQNVAGFERVLDSLFVQPAADIYVTGSNARFLSSRNSAYMTGILESPSRTPGAAKAGGGSELSTIDSITDMPSSRAVKARYLGFDWLATDDGIVPCIR